MRLNKCGFEQMHHCLGFEKTHLKFYEMSIDNQRAGDYIAIRGVVSRLFPILCIPALNVSTTNYTCISEQVGFANPLTFRLGPGFKPLKELELRLQHAADGRWMMRSFEGAAGTTPLLTHAEGAGGAAGIFLGIVRICEYSSIPCMRFSRRRTPFAHSSPFLLR